MVKKYFFLLILITSLSSQLFSQNQFRAFIQAENYTQSFQVCKDDPETPEAFPKSDTLIYDWFKEEQLIFSSSNEKLTIKDGSYNVAIKAINFQSESEEVKIENSQLALSEFSKSGSTNNIAVYPTISSVNPVICGSNKSAVLQASPVNAAFSYQWSYSTGEYNSYTNISGATGNSHTTTTLGYYKVTVNDGTGANTSNFYTVFNTATVTLTNTANNTNPIDINAGGSATLKVNLTGESPWNFTLYDGVSNKYYTTNTTPYYVNVSPIQSRIYKISEVFNSCGTRTTTFSNNIIINILPITLSLPTPIITTVCKQSMIEIPYSLTGTNLGMERSVRISLIDNVTGIENPLSVQSNQNANPIKYIIPALLPVGTYKVNLKSELPYIHQSITSNYTITVTPEHYLTCIWPSAYITTKLLNSCSGSFLEAYPQGINYSEKWYKDGVLINQLPLFPPDGATSGNYSVVVTSSIIGGYSSTSPSVTITTSGIQKNVYIQGGNTLCNSNSSIVLVSNNNGSLEIKQQ